MEADRIVIGSNDRFAQEKLRDLYRPMGIPIYCVTASTGEFIKYLSNSLLAVLISFSNEMAHVADTIGGIQTAEAFRILHQDKRWSGSEVTSYIYPGCGYGGYCLPKDTKALYAKAIAVGAQMPVLEAVIATNENRAAQVAVQIMMGTTLDQVVGILGLAFKLDSDDVRDTPAYKIIEQLHQKGYRNFVAYDPIAATAFQVAYPNLSLQYCASVHEVYQKADVVAIVTAWPEFQNIRKVGNKRVVDCRYMLHGEEKGEKN